MWKTKGKKTLNREHGYCYLEGGAGVSTGVSYLSNKPISLPAVHLRFVYVYTRSIRATWPLIYVCECISQWILHVFVSADSQKEVQSHAVKLQSHITLHVQIIYTRASVC